MANIENQRGFYVDLAAEVLDLDTNLYETYQKAEFEAKGHYLSIFFDRIEVIDRKIQKVTYALLFQKLLDAKQVTLSSNWLSAPQPSMQRTPVPIIDGFEIIIKAFENVSYMGELRQRWVEIKKLKSL